VIDDRRTIAAIATAPGRGAVAIVRVSGPDAFDIAERLTSRRPEPGRVAVRDVSFGGTLLDRCVVLAFAGPRSYTGEDSVEFQCHGGSVVPRRILEACFAAGARLANRGEFTERAFLNGRMDLSEAESVIELVDAKTDRAAADALARNGGSAARAYRALYDKTLQLSTTLEHALDVDEADLPPGFIENAASAASAVEDEIVRALARAREGRILRDGALVVLAGPPNAGKSSLMNALLGTSRAIVSAAPGTTRDSIEEWLDINGWPVRLVDTAGLRGTSDEIEAEGVRRAEALISKADVVLALDCDVDGAISVHSKCDLGRKEGVLNVSSVTGGGLDNLKDAIVKRLAALGAAASEDTPTPSAREISLLEEAREALARQADDIVLMANSARTAADALARLVGATYSDDLLDSLFSRFCVGK
jgi:tRNA modification GTPase